MKINKTIVKKSMMEIIAILISATYILLMIIGGPTVLTKEKYDIIFLGDSIFGNVRDNTSIPALVEEATGKKCFNGGLGGTTAACFYGKSMTDVVESSASLCSLTQSVRTREFNCLLSMQEIRDDGDLDYFDGVVKEISDVKFSSSEIIIIEHGLNDYFFNIEIGDDNNCSKYTYYGALLSSIEDLKKACPRARIILVTPVTADEEAKKYADAMIKAGEKKQVEVIDMYRKGVVTKENIKESTIDGTHLSESARREYAQILQTYIK